MSACSRRWSTQRPSRTTHMNVDSKKTSCYARIKSKIKLLHVRVTATRRVSILVLSLISRSCSAAFEWRTARRRVAVHTRHAIRRVRVENVVSGCLGSRSSSSDVVCLQLLSHCVRMMRCDVTIRANTLHHPAIVRITTRWRQRVRYRYHGLRTVAWRHVVVDVISVCRRVQHVTGAALWTLIGYRCCWRTDVCSWTSEKGLWVKCRWLCFSERPKQQNV